MKTFLLFVSFLCILFLNSCQKAWDCNCVKADSTSEINTKVIHANEQSKALAKCSELQPTSICQVTPHNCIILPKN